MPGEQSLFPISTSTNPLVALNGTLISMASGSHRWTKAETPLTTTLLNSVDLKFPNPSPLKISVEPGVAVEEESAMVACLAPANEPLPSQTRVGAKRVMQRSTTFGT